MSRVSQHLTNQEIFSYYDRRKSHDVEDISKHENSMEENVDLKQINQGQDQLMLKDV